MAVQAWADLRGPPAPTYLATCTVDVHAFCALSTINEGHCCVLDYRSNLELLGNYHIIGVTFL